ncbi:MAG: hypothetical protein NC453_25575 [Muribaculum sp.]|nr:hypothetical protein [Muribaculum sp.]
MIEDIDTREWQRKRFDHFSEIVKKYTSFDDFISQWDEKMALWGVELSKHEENNYVTIYVQLDYCGYNEFHVIIGKDGHLTLSKGVGMEEICANMIIDIDSGEYLDEYPEKDGPKDE